MRDNTKNRGLIFLESANQLLCASLTGGAAVQNQTRPPENRPEKRRERRGRFAELGEHQHLFLPGGNHLRDFAQTRELAAVALRSQPPSPSHCDG